MSDDPNAIATAQLVHMQQAWNQADGAAFGEVFTDDSDFVDIRGGYHRGRAAIAEGHQALFDSIYAGSTNSYQLEVARMATPGCVVAVAGATMCAPIGPLQGTNHARFTMAITQHDGRWVVSTFHNTLVAERP